MYISSNSNKAPAEPHIKYCPKISKSITSPFPTNTTAPMFYSTAKIIYNITIVSIRSKHLPYQPQHLQNTKNTTKSYPIFRAIRKQVKQRGGAGQPQDAGYHQFLEDQASLQQQVTRIKIIQMRGRGGKERFLSVCIVMLCKLITEIKSHTLVSIIIKLCLSLCITG